MNDKRSHERDRRNYRQRQEYPLQDFDNIVVLADRRRVPDRRTHLIEVDWVEEDIVIFQ